MSSRRTLILIAAVVIAAISAFLVFNYVNSADDRARANAREVEILKVQKDIRKGITGREAVNDGSIVTAKIPAEFKPATAITDPSIIADKVAVAPLATGQILVDGMFADAIENQITFAGRVPDQCGPADASGQLQPCVGVTISVDAVHGVAGVIVPGDSVNIMVVPETSNCGSSAGSKGAVVSKPEGNNAGANANDGGAIVCNPARVLYQAAKVLFVDKTAVPQPGEVSSTGSSTATPNGQAQTNVNSGLITLEVPPAAAQLIASISPEELYLTLLPQNYKPEALPKPDAFPTQLPGENPSQLTPYGPDGIQNQK